MKKLLIHITRNWKTTGAGILLFALNSLFPNIANDTVIEIISGLLIGLPDPEKASEDDQAK